MKVLKFGGTSVGSVASLTNVRKIVESRKDTVVVVVSALSGVTDQLIKLGQTAQKGGNNYKNELEKLQKRHFDTVEALIDKNLQKSVKEKLDTLFAELNSILYGVSLLQDNTPKSADAIVSYGERLSATIVTALIPDATHIDARQIIKTEAGKKTADLNATNAEIQKINLKNVNVVEGFIASDVKTGAVTNLGRGGSDYTAALIAAALKAECLEIWTDVDGFMTADPRVIANAVTIPELSYGEAMELCNFGAKVVYPPTIYPVCASGIPIFVRNTFRPEFGGTKICANPTKNDRPIRGISSVNETTLVTVHGLSMVGVVGVNRRIFTRMAEGGVSVFLVAQSSS